MLSHGLEKGARANVGCPETQTGVGGEKERNDICDAAKVRYVCAPLRKRGQSTEENETEIKKAKLAQEGSYDETIGIFLVR